MSEDFTENRLGAASGATPALLDSLADRGWPAIERIDREGWTLRFSSGVTNRANSVLPSASVTSSSVDFSVAVDAAEREYAARGLPTVFQLSEAAPDGLAEELAASGYVEHSHTAVMVASANAVAGPSGSDRIVITDLPGDAWLDLWWSVDGRGGDAERETARRILTGTPALYGALHPAGDASGRPSCVARLALVDDWGGLFAVATHPDARRRGFAREVIEALRAEARQRGIRKLWLQVMADNRAALRLYEGLGFVAASSYSYWSQP
jgi:ribosomal protein S18 acetylase RimI-like enzyme